MEWPQLARRVGAWYAGGEAILSDGVEESQFAVAVTLDVNTLGV